MCSATGKMRLLCILCLTITAYIISVAQADTVAFSTPAKPRQQLAQNAPGDTSAKPPFSAAKAFATTCGWCHADGGRVADVGPKLMGTTLTDDEILYRIRNGKEGAMPPFKDVFSEEELRALLTYIRELR